MSASRFRTSRLATFLSFAAFAPLALGAPQAADASTTATGSVTMVGETGDYVSAGQSNLFDASNATIQLGGTLQHATVALSGGSFGTSYTFDFAPPSGQTLQPGVYAAAQRYPFQVTGRPGLDVGGDGRGCNEETGTFTVKDVHADGSGNLDRLWVLYEDHCESAGAPALFGEVRLGEPASGTAASAEPSAVRWPGTDQGRPTRVVPVTVVAGSAGEHVNSVSLGGTNPGDFAVRLDQCSGQTLSAGGRCQVFLRFTPAASGERGADLVVTNSDASVVDVALSGFAYGGTTRMDLQSDPGDFIGAGGYSSYSTANAKFTASGTRQHVTVQVSGDDGSAMTALFSPGTGDILAAGSTYSPVARDPFRNGGAGLEVTGNGRGCNVLTGQFTVLDANFDPGGNLLDFGASFVQHCEGGGPALRGTFQVRSPSPASLLPVNSSAPTVSGAALVGQTLQSSAGRWNDASTAFGYQWQRCSSGSCTDIPGATGVSYAVGSGDIGAQIALEVNLTNAAGQSAWVRSAPTAEVPAPRPTGGVSAPPPGNIASPTSSSAPAADSTTLSPIAASTPPASAPGAAVSADSFAVAAHQPSSVVARRGLSVRVVCSVACTVDVSVTPAPKGIARQKRARVLGHLKIDLPAGSHTLHVRVRRPAPRRLIVTSTVRLITASHAATAAPLRSSVTLF